VLAGVVLERPFKESTRSRLSPRGSIDPRDSQQQEEGQTHAADLMPVNIHSDSF
jgi:hypothetical protein